MVSSSISRSENVSAQKDSSFNFTTKTDSKSLDFSKIMTASISSNTAKATAFTSKNSTTDNKALSKTTSVKDSNDVKSANNVKNTNDVNNTNNVKDTKNAQNANNTKEDTAVNNTDTVTKDVSKKLDQSDSIGLDITGDNKIDGLTSAIKDQIKKIFGISDEQLETAMANLGITIQDLLQPVNLTNLVCEITGTKDALTLLTDKGLSEQLKSVMDAVNTQVNNLAQDLNVSIDDLKAFIENSSSANQEPAVDNHVDQIQPDENTSAIKVQSEELPKNINLEETTKTDSNDQSKSDLQSVVETKVTVETQKESNGAMSKNSNGSSENKHEFNTLTNNLSQSIQDAFDKVVTQDESKVNTADVIKQIVEAAKVTVTQEISSMEIQLNPENLGKVNLSVVAKDGVITAQITAENETVKKAIENQMSVLKENFINQGIKVEAVEVTIASHSFESNQNLSKDNSNQDANGKNTNKAFRYDSIEDLQDDELSEDERRVMQLLNGDNSSVEYSA